MRRAHIAIAGLLIGAVGLLASCDHDKKKPDTYGQQPPPACEKVAPTPVNVSQPPTPAEQAACAAAGGEARRDGLAGFFSCILPLCDANQPCSDSSECIGRCYATGTVAAPGAPATGACQPTTSPFGCRTEIVGGVAGPTLCVD